MTKMLALCGTLALLSSVATVHASILIDNTTRNGSFETFTSDGDDKVFFIDGNVANWTNWTEQDTADDDTGTDAPTDGSTQTGLDGVRLAFLQPEGAILNMTAYVIQEGDVIDYSFWNSMVGRGDATISLVWDNAGSMDMITGTALDTVAGNQAVGQYTVQTGDAWIGSTLGVGIATSGFFPEVDQVFLEAIPEPATLSLISLLTICCLWVRRIGLI